VVIIGSQEKRCGAAGKAGFFKMELAVKPSSRAGNNLFPVCTPSYILKVTSISKRFP